MEQEDEVMIKLRYGTPTDRTWADWIAGLPVDFLRQYDIIHERGRIEASHWAISLLELNGHMELCNRIQLMLIEYEQKRN